MTVPCELLMFLMTLIANGLAIDVDIPLPTKREIRSLEQIIEWREKPSALRCENGSVFISRELIVWTAK